MVEIVEFRFPKKVFRSEKKLLKEYISLPMHKISVPIIEKHTTHNSIAHTVGLQEQWNLLKY